METLYRRVWVLDGDPGTINPDSAGKGLLAPPMLFDGRNPGEVEYALANPVG